jgi:hypothetical protein
MDGGNHKLTLLQDFLLLWLALNALQGNGQDLIEPASITTNAAGTGAADSRGLLEVRLMVV